MIVIGTITTTTYMCILNKKLNSNDKTRKKKSRKFKCLKNIKINCLK